MGLRIESNTSLLGAARLYGAAARPRVGGEPGLLRGSSASPSNPFFAGSTADNARGTAPGSEASNNAAPPLLGETRPDAAAAQGRGRTGQGEARAGSVESVERSFQPEAGQFTRDLQQAAARAGYLARQYVNGFGEAAQRISARLEGTPPPNTQTVNLEVGGRSFTYGYLRQEPSRFDFTA